MRPDDIVAYDYRANRYCPECIVDALAYKQWIFTPNELTAFKSGPVEDALNILADGLGINRDDERSFDAGDFPKVVFRDQVSPGDSCGSCGRNLKEVV